MLFAIDEFLGYLIVIAVVGLVCLLTYFIRRKYKIGTYTEEEIANMKSNLDLLLTEEEIEDGKDYRDEV